MKEWNEFVARLPQCDALEDVDDLRGALHGVAIHHDEYACDAYMYIRQYADGHVTVERPEEKGLQGYSGLETLKKAWRWEEEDEENAQAEQADKAKRRARAYRCTCAHCGEFIGLEREAQCDSFGLCGTCEACEGEEGLDVAEFILEGANPSPENLDSIGLRELYQESIKEGAPSAYKTYARIKRDAILARQRGEITWALRYEENADKTYKEIPPEWQW